MSNTLKWIKSRSWRWSSLLTLVFCVGLGIELWQWVGGRPFWLDEEMIALNFRDRAYGGVGSALWLGQSAPIGWLAIERVVVRSFGTDERALRLFPTLFGLAILASALWVGRRWMTVLGAATLLLLLSFGEWFTYFPNELKHYSADAFSGLLLPSLAAWVAESAEWTAVRRSMGSRAVCWWTTAAVGQFFANGALFVMPGCAVALFAIAWRRGGSRLALSFAALGVIWAVAFAVNYGLGLRFASGSAYLNAYWAFAFPPHSAGLLDTARWLGRQAEPFAIKPGGTGLWIIFWTAAVIGLLVGPQPLGLMGLTVAMSLPVLAMLRVAPLYERVSLWALPMLYVGIALSVDTAVRMGREFWARRTWGGALVALTAAVGAFVGLKLCADVVASGLTALEVGRDPRTNHALDDRGAVRWLQIRQRPGDVWMTTHLGLPAVWWYGHIPMTDPLAGSREADGTPIFEAQYKRRGCSSDELRQALQGHIRVLLYLGFRFDDVPKGFDDLLLNTLSEFGAATESRGFGPAGRVWIIDLRRPGSSVDAATRDHLTPGCIRVRTADRW
jgi:hypothetical protein